MGTWRSKGPLPYQPRAYLGKGTERLVPEGKKEGEGKDKGEERREG